MPSDERIQIALDALVEQRAAFRTAVATAHEQVRDYLASHGARAAGGTAADAVRELGAFAGGRIDGTRFAALGGEERILSPEAEAVVRQCDDVLAGLVARGDSVFVAELIPGYDLRSTVDAALAELGRAFGAALVFQAVRTGVYKAEQHEPLLRAFPYRRWNRAERMLAPPLVVPVLGADVDATGLEAYLDGRQKLVLVVTGACPPAPLARVVTPGLFARQAERELGRTGTFAGPAIAALVPEGAALFTHDPAVVAEERRLVVTRRPAEAPRAAIGGWSVAQQRDELALLDALDAADAARVAAATAARVAAGPTLAGATSGDGQAVSTLAGWLLAEAGIGPAAGGAA